MPAVDAVRQANARADVTVGHKCVCYSLTTTRWVPARSSAHATSAPRCASGATNPDAIRWAPLPSWRTAISDDVVPLATAYTTQLVVDATPRLGTTAVASVRVGPPASGR